MPATTTRDRDGSTAAATLEVSSHLRPAAKSPAPKNSEVFSKRPWTRGTAPQPPSLQREATSGSWDRAWTKPGHAPGRPESPGAAQRQAPRGIPPGRPAIPRRFQIGEAHQTTRRARVGRLTAATLLGSRWAVAGQKGMAVKGAYHSRSAGREVFQQRLVRVDPAGSRRLPDTPSKKPGTAGTATQGQVPQGEALRGCRGHDVDRGRTDPGRLPQAGLRSAVRKNA